MQLLYNVFYKNEEKHDFMFFYLQINVFNIYACNPTGPKPSSWEVGGTPTLLSALRLDFLALQVFNRSYQL